MLFRSRAQRRHAELLGRGNDVTLEAVQADLAARDEADANRKAAPLVAASDAMHLDTTALDIDAAFAQAMELIKGRLG